MNIFPMCRANCRDFQCRRLGRCKNHQASTGPDVLAEDFGDPETLFNSREWLRQALEANGAKIVGGGIGMGACDLDIIVEGCEFNVTLRPRIKTPPHHKDG